MKRPFSLYLLLALHLFLGINAIAGGSLLIIKPDGSLLGMRKEWLMHSPFSSFIIPGFLLFLFSGLLPLFAFFGLAFKPALKWPQAMNIYSNRHWAWAYSLYSGIILIVWITVQLIMTQYFWIQPVMIFTGLLIIIFTLTPTVMNHFELHNEMIKIKNQF